MLYYVPKEGEDTTKFPGGDGGISVREMKFPGSRMDAAEIQLVERYPERGKALNEKSEMMVYILAGSVRLECDGEEALSLPAGSAVLVPPDKPYSWTPLGHGRVKLLIVSSPPWSANQQQIVTD